nr:unnamed protein product [Callosobruchus analis]
MLLYCCPKIIPFITHIVNECILRNYFPVRWKHALIMPLPKISQPSELKDLRNISILPTLSKVLERVLETQIREHLQRHDLIVDVQSGFRPAHSCATALLGVVDDVLCGADRGDLTALVLLDYTKAFDRIHHGLLLAMLHYYGFSHNAESLMCSYFKNRQQQIVLNNEYSYSTELTMGVPQGSILGPLLFIAYTSNLHFSLHHCKAQFYADDTQIYLSFPPDQVLSACELINKDLENLVRASRNICLDLNPSKSEIMLFGPKKWRDKCEPLVKIKLNQNILRLTPVVRNLGLYLDKDLRFEEHINKCCRKAYCNLKLIYGQRFFLNRSTKIMLCNSLVLSHFSFCDVVYGNCLTKFSSDKIQRVQNACLRLTFGIRKYDSVTVKFTDLGWLNMKQRRLLHSLVLYHKIVINKLPSFLYKKLNFRHMVHNRNTRNKTQLTPVYHTTTLFERSFSYNIGKLYNNIPQQFKTLPVNLFKRNIINYAKTFYVL